MVATYQISFGQNLTSADNGGYSVTLNANSVKNTGGIAAGAGSIGMFTLLVLNVVPSALVPAFGSVNLAASVVAGGKLNAKLVVLVTNTGSAFNGHVTLNLYANTGTSLDGTQKLISTAPKKLVLKAGKSKPFRFAVKSLPATLPEGTYHLLAEVVDPSGQTNAVATTQTVQVTAPTITPRVTVGAVSPSTIAIGKAGAVVVTIANAGNVVAGGLDVTLSLSVDGTNSAGAILVKTLPAVKLQVGKSKTFKLHFKIIAAQTPGRYFPYVSVLLGNVSATAVGATPFTIG